MPNRIKVHKPLNLDAVESNSNYLIQALETNSPNSNLDENFFEATTSSLTSIRSSISYASNNFIDIQTKETSPELNDSSSNSFHIDSPPSKG